MQKTKIEYLTHTWNFQTGCLNKQNGVCNLPCWAEAMAHRFHKDFTPKFHANIFHQAMPRNARIGVCFTGDLFGDWVNPDDIITPLATLKDLTLLKIEVERNHNNSFFFLTKCPWNYRKWGNFPDNAYVGATVCNDDMLSDALDSFNNTNAKHKWLSIEPLLEPLNTSRITKFLNLKEQSLSWVVIGGQTHPNFVPPVKWILDIMDVCFKNKIRVFVKDNLNSLALEIPMYHLYPKDLTPLVEHGTDKEG